MINSVQVGLLRLHHAAGFPQVLAHRSDRARAGRLHGLPEHPAGRRLELVAQKLQSSLAVEGELSEDGLAAYGDDGDDLMLGLARKIVAGEKPGRSSGVRPRLAG